MGCLSPVQHGREERQSQAVVQVHLTAPLVRRANRDLGEFYVSLDYRSEFAAFYAHIDAPRRSVTTRLHFFGEDIPPAKVIDLAKDSKKAIWATSSAVRVIPRWSGEPSCARRVTSRSRRPLPSRSTFSARSSSCAESRSCSRISGSRCARTGGVGAALLRLPPRSAGASAYR